MKRTAQTTTKTSRKASGTTHVTPADGNVFADLGFAPKEAKKLLSESNRRISETLAIKRALMDEVAAWIAAKDLRQEDAAERLHVTRPRVSDVVNHKTEKFTIDALVDMVNRTGKRVTLAIR
jgi:predicted XRE-type DNA-binding protein